jgi:hypothetical protein
MSDVCRQRHAGSSPSTTSLATVNICRVQRRSVQSQSGARRRPQDGQRAGVRRRSTRTRVPARTINQPATAVAIIGASC